METATRVSRKRSHEEVYAPGDDIQRPTASQYMAQLQEHHKDGGNITTPEQEGIKREVTKDLAISPSASTSDAMSVDGDGDEEGHNRDIKKKNDTLDPASIPPGMMGTCIFFDLLVSMLIQSSLQLLIIHPSPPISPT